MSKIILLLDIRIKEALVLMLDNKSEMCECDFTDFFKIEER